MSQNQQTEQNVQSNIKVQNNKVSAKVIQNELNLKDYEKIEDSEHFVTIDLGKKYQKFKKYKFCQQQFQENTGKLFEQFYQIQGGDKIFDNKLILNKSILSEIDDENVLGTQIIFIAGGNNSKPIIQETHIIKKNILLHLNPNEPLLDSNAEIINYTQIDVSSINNSNLVIEKPEKQILQDLENNDQLQKYLKQNEIKIKKKKIFKKPNPENTKKAIQMKSFNYLLDRVNKKYDVHTNQNKQ